MWYKQKHFHFLYLLLAEFFDFVHVNYDDHRSKKKKSMKVQYYGDYSNGALYITAFKLDKIYGFKR